MPQTRWNKIKTIVNSDAYNLSGDMATEADYSNVVVPVASQAERDALVPPQGVYAGMAVARTDLPGVPIQTRDGSGVWSTQQTPKVWANGVLNGSPSNPLSGLQSGAYVPIIQAGTWVGTPDVNGYANLTFPAAFPNALITVGGWVGDNTVANAQRYIITNGSAASNLTTFYFRCWDSGANSPAPRGQSVNLFAIGI